MICPICGKRKPERFCPAKGETICAVCCGTEREVTIDCPSDCTYLIRARRNEEEHRQRLSPKELPLPDVRIPPGLPEERSQVVAAMSANLLEFAAENRGLHDADVAAAVAALADTYRTLSSGLYYEKPPDGGLPRSLYSHLAEFIEKLKAQDAERAGFPTIKDTELFYLLVFLLRVARVHSNGRPRSRAFLDFLREEFPQAVPAQAPRIVLP